MLRVTRPQKVRWIDEGRHRMMVRSDGNEIEEYLVDLMENYPIGWCGCPDYAFNRRIKEDKPIEHKRCKHIKAARAWLGEQFVDADIKQTKNKALRDKAAQRQAASRIQNLQREVASFP